LEPALIPPRFISRKKLTPRKAASHGHRYAQGRDRNAGGLDDAVVTEIIATGTTAEELAEAHAWLANDEPLMNAGRPLPSGRVAHVVNIVAAISEEEAGEEIARRS
jgi:hypothetical protein